MNNTPKKYQDYVGFVESKALRGRSKTEYLRQVRKLGAHYAGRELGRISEREVFDYLIHLRVVQKLRPSTLNQAVVALRMFFRDFAGLTWVLWEQFTIRRDHPLPVVLTRRETRQLLRTVRSGRFRAVLTLIYHCGLRVGEAVAIKPGHIDNERGILRIVNGKGGKMREVPISTTMIKKGRQYWCFHRNPRWLLPGVGRGWKERTRSLARAMGEARQPMSVPSVQNALRMCLPASGVKKNATCHTLRHSFLRFAPVASRLHQQLSQQSGLRYRAGVHPHIHTLIPAVGLSESGCSLHHPRFEDYLIPHKSLARATRDALCSLLADNHPAIFARIPSVVWSTDWIAQCQSAGRGRSALRYLAAYVKKTAFHQDRLEGFDPSGRIILRYRDSADNTIKREALTPHELIRRWLLHVLPKGLVRVRHYGWLSPAAHRAFLRVCFLLGLGPYCAPANPPAQPPLCPCCRGPLSLLGSITPVRGPPLSRMLLEPVLKQENGGMRALASLGGKSLPPSNSDFSHRLLAFL